MCDSTFSQTHAGMLAYIIRNAVHYGSLTLAVHLLISCQFGLLWLTAAVRRVCRGAARRRRRCCRRRCWTWSGA